MLRRFLILCIASLTQLVIVQGQIFNSLEDIEKYEKQLQIRNFVSSLVSYPFESLSNKEVGVLIGEIQLMSSDQQDSVYICNPISERIDEKFMNALNIALACYRSDLEEISENDKITFYVIFKIENNEFGISYNNIPDEFIGPLKMTIGNIIRSSNPQLPEKKISIQPDSYYFDKIKECRLKIDKLIIASKDVSSLKKKLNAKLIFQKENQIIDNLDELIRRNPFNPELLKQRSELYKSHDDLVKAERDDNFIKNYIKSKDNQE